MSFLNIKKFKCFFFIFCMKICGLQKTTLIDYPGKIACTIFLYGCNFRCGFCHNPELVIESNNNIIPEEEIINFLEKRKKYLEGVCITGGEALISLKIDFVKKIKDLGYLVKLDTNGSLPERLKEFLRQGLIDFISMDIKSSREKYSFLTGVSINVHDIEESIKLIINSGLDYEFRTTVLEDFHDKEEIKKIALWLNNLTGEKPKKYILQGFKNSGKFIDQKYKLIRDVSEDYLEELKQEINDFFKDVEIRV